MLIKLATSLSGMACLLLQSLIVHHVQEPILNFTWKTPKVSNQQLSYHNILNVFILMYKFIYFICDRNVLEAWSWILASYLTRISLVKDFIFLGHIFDFFVFVFLEWSVCPELPTITFLEKTREKIVQNKVYESN